MAHWMTLGQQAKVNAKNHANKLALKDHARSFSYAQTYRRVNQLAYGLMGLFLDRSDICLPRYPSFYKHLRSLILDQRSISPSQLLFKKL